jgi:hypothetical protein
VAVAGIVPCEAFGGLSRGRCGVRSEPGEGTCLQVCAGQRVARTVSVAVRAIRRWGARRHGHIADSVAAANLTWWCLRRSGAVWRCRKESTVKPSAQPTLVRTQHLPPPGKMARSLRKRGPAGRFLLVPPCVMVCRCRAWRSDRYGQIADSVRAEGAVRGTACFADPRPFCPVSGRPDCSPDWYIPRIPSGRFSAVLLAMDGGLVLFVPAAGAGSRISPRHPIEAATEAVTECASPAAGWKTGTAPWRATLRAGLEAARRHAVRVSRCPLSGTGSGRAGHVLVVD